MKTTVNKMDKNEQIKISVPMRVELSAEPMLIQMIFDIIECSRHEHMLKNSDIVEILSFVKNRYELRDDL